MFTERLVKEGRLKERTESSQSQEVSDWLEKYKLEEKDSFDGLNLNGEYFTTIKVNKSKSEVREVKDTKGVVLLGEYTDILRRLCAKETSFGDGLYEEEVQKQKLLNKESKSHTPKKGHSFVFLFFLTLVITYINTVIYFITTKMTKVKMAKVKMTKVKMKTTKMMTTKMLRTEMMRTNIITRWTSMKTMIMITMIVK